MAPVWNPTERSSDIDSDDKFAVLALKGWPGR